MRSWRERLLQRLGDVVLADDLGERLRAVAAVQRLGHGIDPSRADRRIGRAVPRGGTKGPPAHPPEPAYPCCLPALGEFSGVTPHEGSRPSLTQPVDGATGPAPMTSAAPQCTLARDYSHLRTRVISLHERHSRGLRNDLGCVGTTVAGIGTRLLRYPRRAEDSHSGLVRTLGKRVGVTPSRVRISHPPPIQASTVSSAARAAVSGGGCRRCCRVISRPSTAAAERATCLNAPRLQHLLGGRLLRLAVRAAATRPPLEPWLASGPASAQPAASRSRAASRSYADSRSTCSAYFPCSGEAATDRRQTAAVGRRHLRLRRPQPRPGHRRRRAAVGEHGDDRLADAELGQHLLEVVGRSSGTSRPSPSAPWRRPA